MQPLPPLTSTHALFLDFDGTLTELALRPDAVTVAAGLIATLSALHTHLGGALAIVTGRPEADIDHFLTPLRLPLASEHGAQYRLAHHGRPAIVPPGLAPVVRAAHELAAQHDGLLLEHKTAGLVLHYRQAPHLERLCHDTLARAIQAAQDLELQPGKCVLEVKPRGVHKGRAIADFMAWPPFADRMPVFAGDDIADEAGFAAVQALGGWGIKMGAGTSTAARHPLHCVAGCRLRAATGSAQCDARTMRPCCPPDSPMPGTVAASSPIAWPWRTISTDGVAPCRPRERPAPGV